ncbi:MAG: hypothetical protein IAF08_11925 [Rhizobacter sp.]|nr:hypothetical protein [Chlorobiales bacterium]
MGFLFYITDFWYWRWKRIFESANLRFLDRQVLKFYYINFFFVIFNYTALLRRLGRTVLNQF